MTQVTGQQIQHAIPPKSPLIRLQDYAPPAWTVHSVDLLFKLDPTQTRVIARLELGSREPGSVLKFDGRKLKLIRAAINGEDLDIKELEIDSDSLTVPKHLVPDEPFVWECETEINPKDNTALEGLYMSKGMFCTQCEAQGFRKITYYFDRPDVMSVFTVRIEANKKDYPVLLSNGNKMEETDLSDGLHRAMWHDPHPKPSYLFALVGGQLEAYRDTFITKSGRHVDLVIYVRDGDQDRCAYAMDALKRSMKWDEDEYGREYDLDLFMIVAVDDFNMGAMENKGLNIFNSKYVLASPDTATDQDYEFIESIIAHEYFHNWTGNRITCRDWFQLCLKEGLTVFRDQQFSASQRSKAVQRIQDVKSLRKRQFREDAGALAHPVRPEVYKEINNFYTATVYDKGAELIRMLRLMVGVEPYRASLDLYFKRHDGEACTVDQFLNCFQEVTGRDLSQFSRWYSQAGTPRLFVEETYDKVRRVYTLTFRQKTPPTPGQPYKKPLVIPVAIGLLDQEGKEMPLPGDDGRGFTGTRVVEISKEVEIVRFENMHNEPVPSILRQFSAPVILERTISDEERAFMLQHDKDPFNMWEAGNSYALDSLLRLSEDFALNRPPRDVSALISAYEAPLKNDDLDPAFKALILTIPSYEEVAGLKIARKAIINPGAICRSRHYLSRQIAQSLKPYLMDTYDDLRRSVSDNQLEAANQRSLKNTCLSLLMHLSDPEITQLALNQFNNAKNMTDRLAGLTVLVHHAEPEVSKEPLEIFYTRWRDKPSVVDKWFAIQAVSPQDKAFDAIRNLTTHPAFTWKTPNRFRSLIGVFSMENPMHFHGHNGKGYSFVVDWLIKMDALNPQITARAMSIFEQCAHYDRDRQQKMTVQLNRLLDEENLSRDTSEMIERILNRPN